MLDELNDAGNELNVIILDACRDNPYSWKRGSSRGLTLVANQPVDSIIVFATAAGSTAADGSGRNGLFTSHLLNNLKIPGLEVTEVFRRTMGDVANASGNQQRPAIYNQFPGTAFLGSKPSAEPEIPAISTEPKITVTHQEQILSSIAEKPTPSGMLWINGGIFFMGSPDNEPRRNANEVQHEVTVNSFYIGKYEVTQKEYEEVMGKGKNPSNFKGQDLPVEMVSWYDAIDYCNKRSQMEGLTPAYSVSGTNVNWNQSANGYRLPTEAEWEYACRAGTNMPFSTGNSITTAQANYDGNNPYNDNAKGTARQKTSYVGSFQPSPWGLFDMHGNVSEWCWDWYGTYNTSRQIDPVGPSSGANRVIRGGSWTNGGRDIRSSTRNYGAPSYRSGSLGFRIARSL
jgi:formylglycine-generating enzyme required for sulfatase activity